MDDDAVFRDAVSAVLETRFDVRVAANGGEALDQVRRQAPDLIVLDVMLDYLSEGFDIARRLRSDPAWAAIPILMLTGVDQTYDYRMEVDEAWVPCERYLEKPVEPERLLLEIEALVG